MKAVIRKHGRSIAGLFAIASVGVNLLGAKVPSFVLGIFALVLVVAAERSR